MIVGSYLTDFTSLYREKCRSTYVIRSTHICESIVPYMWVDRITYVERQNINEPTEIS